MPLEGERPGRWRVTAPDAPETEERLAAFEPLGAYLDGTRWRVYFEDRGAAEAAANALAGEVDRPPDEDWHEKWRSSLRPVRVGPFLITPDPDLGRTVSEQEIRIVIEPLNAFGTGEHETTRGSLALIARFLRRGDAVLDFGCGSGILAIAAIKLGAAKAAAVDVDADALGAAAKNAEENGVALELGLSMPEERFSFIVANIQSSVLLPLIPRLTAALEDGGVLVISGFLASEPPPPGRIAAKIVSGEWASYAIAKGEPRR